MDMQNTLRLFLATLALRFQHAVHGAPEAYPTFTPGHGVRTVRAITEHCILMFHGAATLWRTGDWAGPDFEQFQNCSWNDIIQLFHDRLAELDAALVERRPETDLDTMYRLYQGPLSDAMTHIGQLIMMRRLMDAPVAPCMYYKADLKPGDVGPDQMIDLP